MIGAVRSSLRLASQTQVRRMAAKKTEDPVRAAFVAKLKEYAKNRDPKYTQNLIKKMMQGK